MEDINNKIIDEYRFYKTNLSNLDSCYSFGKYISNSIKDVLKINPTYINFALLKVDFFLISPNTLQQIILENPGIHITPEAIYRNQVKFAVYSIREEIYQREREESSNNYENYLNYGENEDYYDDRYDMDQQCEEFYNQSKDDEYYEYENEDEIDEEIPLYHYAILRGIYKITLNTDQNDNYYIDLINVNIDERKEYLIERIKFDETYNNFKLEETILIFKKNEIFARKGESIIDFYKTNDTIITKDYDINDSDLPF